MPENPIADFKSGHVRADRFHCIRNIYSHDLLFGRTETIRCSDE